MAFVEFHRAAWAVDDEHAFGASRFQHLVHARRHLRDALSGVWTGVVVPHVANDNRGLLGVPRLAARDGAEEARLRSCFLSRAEVKLKRLGARGI